MSARTCAGTRALARRQEGLTLVEVVVAVLLLMLGALATFQLFDAANASNLRAEQSQVVNNRLQAELERIGQMPYAEIGLTAAPAGSADSNDPRWRVQGASYAVARDGTSPQQLVINGGADPNGGTLSGGTVSPAPEPFQTGDISGEIYRFVTWTTDPGCTACGTGRLKRIIVAAKVNSGAGYERSFQEVHTDVVDPEATPDVNPPPPDDPVVSGKAEFWLTDTPCNNSARQAPVANHLAHNTRGRCIDALKNGTNRGAPDLMFTGAPTLDPNYPPEGQPRFDYSTDSAGSTNKFGLSTPWADSDSCLLEPALGLTNLRQAIDGILPPLDNVDTPGALDGLLDLDLDITDGTNKHLRVHKWVSPPVGGSGGVLRGKGTLELYSKTVNGTVHPGEICVVLFTRQTVQVPVCSLILVCGPVNNIPLEVDVPFVNTGLPTNQSGTQCSAGSNLTYFRCSRNPWPASWTKISVPLNFAAVDASNNVVPAALPPNSRVGVAVMVKRGGTVPGSGLEFMYDAVGYESRLELETQSVISF